MDCLIVDLAERPGEPGNTMLADMGAALTSHGAAVTPILGKAGWEEGVAAFLSGLPANRRFLLIDGNCRANKWVTDPRAVRFSFMVDHPAYRTNEFVGTSVGTIMGFVDESHLAAADLLKLPFPRLFFPHAGPPPADAVLPMAERSIDVLVCGNFGQALSDAEWRAAHPDVSEELAEPLLGAADHLATSLTTCLDAWIEACALCDFDTARISPIELCRVLVAIETLAQARRRRDVLLGLANHVAVHVIAGELPTYLRGHPNVVELGAFTFSDVRRAFALTKVVINTVAKFAHGSHERIWYAMAAGCVVATDESEFMSRYFSDGANFLILPWGTDQAQFRRHLAGLLRQPEELDAMRVAARPIYERNHTWYQRVTPLVELMRHIDRSSKE